MTQLPPPTNCSPPPMGAWWTSFFDDTYATVGLVSRQGPDAEAAADGIVKLLGLKPGQLVFDQCCGIGRIALPLARRGLRVEGVELAAAYVATAARGAAAESLDARFVCADAYEFVASAACDAAVNVFTSFGYSDDDELNERMMRHAFESLKPGGKYLLERHNPCWIVTFGMSPRASRIAHPDGTEVITIDEPVTDWLRGTIRSTWTIFFADGRRDVRQFETRMFFPNELVAMAGRVGFRDMALFGGIDGAAYDRHSRRLVLTAVRP